jgi:penicillin-binding protein 2
MFVEGMDEKTWLEISRSKDHPLQDRAINGLYPPGSLFKVVVAIAALQEKIINFRTTFFCSGTFHYGNRIYRCWKKEGHGKVDLYRAIKESCDIYFYNLGKMLGVDKIAHYAKMFGLGEKTGIDIGNESKGLVPTSSWKLKKFGIPWQGGENLSLAIGQSYILVTPIQMAVMYSAIFNGGILYKPRITKLIKRPGGEILYRFKPQIKRKLHIKSQYLQFIKKALIAVVNEPHGTGIRARIDGITVAGKTGTVQLQESTNEEEKHIKDHAWFVGVAPAKNPAITVAVIIEHGGHGGSAAAPIAKEIIEYYLKDHVR